jgi:hypothetical protein
MVRRSLLTAALATCTIACAGRLAPDDRTSMAEIAHAIGNDRVVIPHEASSSFVVAIIPELHHLPRCQERVLATLEALRPRTAFVAVEGRIGEVKHEELGGAIAERETEPVYYAQLVARPLGERREMLERWVGPGRYPNTFAGHPAEATLIYEAVYQDEVRTQGMELPQAYGRALRAAERGTASPWSVVVFARNRVFVRKLRHYGDYLGAFGRDVVPFPVGVLHVNDLARRLRNARISYAIVVDEGCLGRP